MNKYLATTLLACAILSAGCGAVQETQAHADEKPITTTGVVDFVYRDGSANSYFTLEDSTEEYICYANQSIHCTFVEIGETVTFSLMGYTGPGLYIDTFTEER